jgi:hypothetical protein
MCLVAGGRLDAGELRVGEWQKVVTYSEGTWKHQDLAHGQKQIQVSLQLLDEEKSREVVGRNNQDHVLQTLE